MADLLVMADDFVVCPITYFKAALQHRVVVTSQTDQSVVIISAIDDDPAEQIITALDFAINPKRLFSNATEQEVVISLGDRCVQLSRGNLAPKNTVMDEGFWRIIAENFPNERS